VVSCGEDGMVRLWAVGGGGEGTEVGKSAEAGKSAEKVSKKAKRKGKKESERFAPY
jgi:hypothetical protein